MTDTPRGAPELAASQAIPETTVNEQVRHTEAGAGHFLVADNDLTAPPGACADGASYIIAATATGAWTGKENYVATAMGTNAANGWTYHAPKEGYTAYIQDENARHLCDGSAWASDTSGGGYSPGGTDVALADGGTGASLADPNADRILFWDDSGGAVTWLTASTGLVISTTNLTVDFAVDSDFRTGTSAAKALTPDGVWDAAAYVTLNDAGGNIAVDLSTGINFAMTMDGDYTLSAPSNGKPGQTGVIQLTQDGSGNQTLAYNSAWKFAGGTDPVLSTAAGAVDLLHYLVLANGTDVYATLTKAVA